ncbi:MULTISPECIES: hypothetical protein [unclassified Microcoleus]|uniref:hypothetical protein n=1 Tax=unclassified Microcoleus TaxID=2642155 RepID=UPI002FD1A169
MINPKNFIYSRAAVARMLGIASDLVKKVEVWANCIFVIVKGRRPRFWKKSSFSNHFVNWRKFQSRYYEVAARSESSFEVWNNKSSYQLSALQQTIQCPCDDYNNQQRIFKGKGCCKHGYAVLTFLGFDRLSEYIENHRWLNEHNSKFIDDDDDYNRSDDWDEASDYYDHKIYG